MRCWSECYCCPHSTLNMWIVTFIREMFLTAPMHVHGSQVAMLCCSIIKLTVKPYALDKMKACLCVCVCGS